MEQNAHNLKESLAMLTRRKRLILRSISLISLAVVAVAFLWPPTYRSTATILIEEREVSPDLVRASITTYAGQRIETIKRQVMSRTNLSKIAEQYGLYPRLRSQGATEELIKRLTGDIHIDVISADVVDRQTHQPAKATIAFTVSYEGERPDLTQTVASGLTDLFLGENLRSRERSTHEATAFLKQEAGNLAVHIEQVENKLAGVKRRADGALPDLLQLNMQLKSQSEKELTDVEQRINALQERKSYLEGQLASIKPTSSTITPAGERILDTEDRLKAVRVQYATSASSLLPEHPDRIKMEKEIESLEQVVGGQLAAEELYKRLTSERAKLVTLLQRYSEVHPDVIRSHTIIASLEKDALAASQTPLKRHAVRPENPAYIQTQAQLNSTVSELKSLGESVIVVKRRTQQYATRLERTPQIEPEYLELVRDRDSSTQKHNDIRSRLMEAQVSQGFESQGKGERFSILDAPNLPEKPVRPNRPVIVLLGLVLAAVCGVGAGAAAESLDHSIQTSEQLKRVTHLPPLAVIPYIPNIDDHARKVKRQLVIRLASAGLALALLFVHFFWLPLDDVWRSALRTLGIE